MDPKTLQAVALEVAAARSLSPALTTMVEGLQREPHIALARIWLIRHGSECETCAMRRECPGDVDCLHLVASSGRSRVDDEQRWDRIDGRFRRFPLDVRKVGRIGATGEPLRYSIEGQDTDWVAEPVWIEQEGIECFAGQPLVFRGEVLGVLAVFAREFLSDDCFTWLRTFADQAAVAIANARAFEEVEDLRTQLELERDYLREERMLTHLHFAGIVGSSPALRQIEQQIEAVAPTDAAVLIQGESGTGKELFACAIHERSRRSKQTMVHVNCAAIPRELFESEFFGHAKGSFTGALQERAGRFQVANGGTLFLDEVGEIPLEQQGKLLRALQEGTYSRVGEDSLRSTDVRVIAATNRDLRAEVDAGRFREDLYYRLSVFPLHAPPLRDRVQDIAPLAMHFVRLSSEASGTPLPKLSQRNVRDLEAYHWPGNVRELRNVIERALILARGGRLQFDLQAARSVAPPRQVDSVTHEIRTDAELRADERSNMLAALEAAEWKISGPGGAAELLGLKPTTLRSRLKVLGIGTKR
jgi:transcriptional regulator with GAF, ATPase, and Fis domain